MPKNSAAKQNVKSTAKTQSKTIQKCEKAGERDVKFAFKKTSRSQPETRPLKEKTLNKIISVDDISQKSNQNDKMFLMKLHSEKTAACDSTSPSAPNDSSCRKNEVCTSEPNQTMITDENMAGQTNSIFEDASVSSQNNKNDSKVVPTKQKFTAQNQKEANEKMNREELKLTRQNSQLEEQLQQLIFDKLSIREMNSIKKFFIVPIGLPGMGKTTLSRFLLNSKNYSVTYPPPLQKHLTSTGINLGQTMNRVTHNGNSQDTFGHLYEKQGPTGENAQSIIQSGLDVAGSRQRKASIKLDFFKISYDYILTTTAQKYCDEHPGTDLNAAIDIIRDEADQQYLDEITKSYGQEYFSQQDAPPLSQDIDFKDTMLKQFIYLDRNNTPDVWPDIQKTILNAHKQQTVKDFRTILIVPKQHKDFQPELYKSLNPICPQMIYECSKRIFNRKQHNCLSGANKPKVADVILKFTKLYDGVDLNDDVYLHKYFDQVVRLDFLHLDQRPALHPSTVATMIECYNETPENFQNPSDETIDKCVKAIDKQIEIDEQEETMLLSQTVPQQGEVKAQQTTQVITN